MTESWAWWLPLISNSGTLRYFLPFVGIIMLAVGTATIAQAATLTEAQKGGWLISIVLLPLAGFMAWIIILATH
jgi:hypothetical protein